MPDRSGDLKVETPLTSRSHLTARSLIVAILTLIFAAGVAAAGRPDAATAPGLERASDASGKTVPLKDADASEGDEASPESQPETAPTVTDATANEHPENHGKYVSEAAQSETPEGCANHGAWVRLFAHSDLGKPGSETTEAPTSCDEPATTEAQAAKDPKATKTKKPLPAHAKGHGPNR